MMKLPLMNREHIDSIFKSFKDKKVLIIGDVMLDAYLWGNVHRISPEAPVPVVHLSGREYRPGGAANVAMNIRQLGALPLLCSVIGNDDDGKRFRKLMKESSISDDLIMSLDNRPTTSKSRVMGNGMQQLIRLDIETEDGLSTAENKTLLEMILRVLPKTDVVIFQDYDKGLISPGIIEKVVKEAEKHQIPIVVDPKRKNFTSYKNVGFFKPNLKELKEGLHISIDRPVNIKQLDAAATAVFEAMQVGTLMITLSEEGVYINNRKESFLITSHKRNIFDVSGAGDTVVSVAALSVAAGLEPALIAELSNIAGGLVCEKVGVVPVDLESYQAECIRLLVKTI